MPQYNIHMKYPDGHIELKEVKGYPVSVPWSDKVEFFIHRPYLNLLNDSWNISEVKTGLSLIENCRGTKQQAIDALLSKFSLNPDAKISLKLMIQEKIAEYGVANGS